MNLNDHRDDAKLGNLIMLTAKMEPTEKLQALRETVYKRSTNAHSVISCFDLYRKFVGCRYFPIELLFPNLPITLCSVFELKNIL